MKKLFKIGLYVRVSTEEQAENPEGSIKNQEERLREFVKLKTLVSPFGEIKRGFYRRWDFGKGHEPSVAATALGKNRIKRNRLGACDRAIALYSVD